MDRLTCIVLFLLGTALLGFIAWQKTALDDANGQITLLQKDLSAAQKDAAGWKETAEATDRAATAQAELADACIKREFQAQADRDNITEIMAKARPQPITPEQARQGVDDATRNRAVDMLNRPW